MPAPTRWPTIAKDLTRLAISPNLVDCEQTCTAFSWADERRSLTGPDGSRLNITHEAVDRHAVGEGADPDALRFVRAEGCVRSLSYAQDLHPADIFWYTADPGAAGHRLHRRTRIRGGCVSG